MTRGKRKRKTQCVINKQTSMFVSKQGDGRSFLRPVTWPPLVSFSAFFLPRPRLHSAPSQHLQWPGVPCLWDAKPPLLRVCLHGLQPQGVRCQGVSPSPYWSVAIELSLKLSLQKATKHICWTAQTQGTDASTRGRTRGHRRSRHCRGTRTGRLHGGRPGGSYRTSRGPAAGADGRAPRRRPEAAATLVFVRCPCML